MILKKNPMTEVDSLQSKGLLAKVEKAWYEHEIMPLMGTSLILEVELSDSDESDDDLSDEFDKFLKQ